MVIVAGHLVVQPGERTRYLEGCREVVEQARRAPGCLDFSITADLLDLDRIDIFERWSSLADVEAFRGSGTNDDQNAVIHSASVSEYEIASSHALE